MKSLSVKWQALLVVIARPAIRLHKMLNRGRCCAGFSSRGENGLETFFRKMIANANNDAGTVLALTHLYGGIYVDYEEALRIAEGVQAVNDRDSLYKQTVVEFLRKKASVG